MGVHEFALGHPDGVLVHVGRPAQSVIPCVNEQELTPAMGRKRSLDSAQIPRRRATRDYRVMPDVEILCGPERETAD